ncbi:hypothetical protein [Flavobacterium sp.]|uniref:hypothetical protein n=1 Tax=Flavobacterium sp. TaxID=239 RepID=UPI003D6C01FF
MIEIFADIGYVILAINLLLFSKGFSKFGKAFRIFTLYTGVMFIIQMVSWLLKYLSINNLFLSHFYFIIQFIILSFFYLTILKENFQKKIVKIGLLLGLSALGIQYMINVNVFLSFNLFEIFITSFLLIIYATFHFYNLLNEKREFYYINMGILIYLFGSTILFLAGNLVATLFSKANRITWVLNALLYIIYQVFVWIEWQKSFSKKKSEVVL